MKNKQYDCKAAMKQLVGADNQGLDFAINLADFGHRNYIEHIN